MRVEPSETFKILESDYNVILQSSLTMTSALLMFSSVRVVTGILGPPSFELDCDISLKMYTII